MRGGGGRGRNIHERDDTLVASHMSPNQGWGWTLQPFGGWEGALSTEPHQPGLGMPVLCGITDFSFVVED